MSTPGPTDEGQLGQHRLSTPVVPVVWLRALSRYRRDVVEYYSLKLDGLSGENGVDGARLQVDEQVFRPPCIAAKKLRM